VVTPAQPAYLLPTHAQCPIPQVLLLHSLHEHRHRIVPRTDPLRTLPSRVQLELVIADLSHPEQPVGILRCRCGDGAVPMGGEVLEEH
jgi:hypothetical protein